MKNYDLIQVLWVEDDPKVIEAYPMEAEQEGLQLVVCKCWDDALEMLEKEYDRWSAIILDAKCKQHADSADNAVVFLRESLKDIAKLAERNNRTIPWYVLTGGSETEVADSINDDRDDWDSDWTESSGKKYYSKNTDREFLFKRIKAHHNKSNRLQIQEMYKNVFSAIGECGISDKAYNCLEELLVPIHFTTDIEDRDYNCKFQNVRICLEYIFRSMAAHGMLPDFGNKWNLQWSSCLLAGKNAEKKKNTENEDSITVVIESHGTVMPMILCDIVKHMVNTIPTDLHSTIEVDATKTRDLKKHKEYVGDSTYLLKSYALQLCDLILWYRHYLKEHSDKEQNRLSWEILNKDLM